MGAALLALSLSSTVWIQPALADRKAGSKAAEVTGPHGERGVGDAIGGRYQVFVTGKTKEELYRLGGQKVWPDHVADASIIEAKWTGNGAKQWSESYYNPKNPLYRRKNKDGLTKEEEILGQAKKLLAVAHGLKKPKGVVYAISCLEGRAHFESLFRRHFNKELNAGFLRLFVVPPVGMP
jgi:hypothetical protein